MKKIIIITGWIVVLCGMFILLGFVEARHKSMICCDFKVLVDFDEAEPLIDVEELKCAIIRAVDSIQGKPIKMINTEGIKAIVLSNPYVKSANVYTNIEGEFNIKIRQREPIIRVIDHQNRSFYIDEEGLLIPTIAGHSARVRVANGYIRDKSVKIESIPLDVDTLPESSLYKQILSLARYIRNNEFLDDQIDQIYINENYEFELIPKVGQHVILFGDLENIDEKFNKLKAFYLDGIKQSGWKKYDQINLKFKHQIVCSKR